MDAKNTKRMMIPIGGGLYARKDGNRKERRAYAAITSARKKRRSKRAPAHTKATGLIGSSRAA